MRSFVPVPLLLALIALSLTVPGSPGAAEMTSSAEIDALSGGDKLHALLDAVVERQRSAEGMRARFTQVKRSDLLLEPAVSTGTFSYLAPEKVRWDYAEPEPMVVLFDQDEITTYHPRQERAEVVEIAARHRRFVSVLAGTQPLDDLAESFSITLSDRGAPAPYTLTLEPIHRVISRRLEKVVLQIDRELMLPVVVQVDEADGDSTRYEFEELEVDPGLDEELFTLDLDTAEVVRIDASSGAGM